MKYYCGGRGSSSSGGSGQFGKGGGLNPANIVSTEDLVSARNEGKRDEVDQALTVARDIFDKYGITNNLDIATLKGKDDNTMAYYGGGNLAFNQKYFDVDKMNTAYDKDVKSGYHPSRGNKSGIEAVMAHELGHSITDEIGKKSGLGSWDLDRVSDVVLKQASKNAGYKNATHKLASKISGYASTSKSEALAEAFADVYCNGSKAKKESKAIVDVMNSYFK